MKSYSYNDDTGDINNIENVDFIIIGMSKCGTTTLYQSLSGLDGKTCIRFHSDYTLERVYKTKELSTKGLLALAKNPQIFIPYREPIRRRISQYHQYALTGSLKDFCLGDYSFISEGYRTEIDENIVYASIADATGINILNHHFNKELGYTKVDNIMFYNLESINRLAAALDLTLINGRISNRAKPNLEFSDIELDEIYSNKYCQHFYTAERINEFKLRAKS